MGGSRGRGLRLSGDSRSCGKGDLATSAETENGKKADRLPHASRALGFCENCLEGLRVSPPGNRDVLSFLLPPAFASFPTSTEPAARKPLDKPALRAAGSAGLQTWLR